jgi:hypothetical protein
VTDEGAKGWNGDRVRAWLERRIEAARAEQARAVRAGRSGEDDCDRASAEEMVCTLVKAERLTQTADAFGAALRGLLDQDDHHWRGVCDDRRFERHVRSFVRTLIRMAKDTAGFGTTARDR